MPLKYVSSKTSNINSLPYKDLYIYYMEGKINHKALEFFQSDFLGNWEEDNTSFLFFTRPATQEISAFLKLHPELILSDKFNMTYDEWCGGNQLPIKLDPFFIIPPWDILKLQNSNSIPDDVIPILLDPGVVFGIGNHPTTADCLKALFKVFEIGNIQTVIDIGTGTGILGIAAAKLGAGQILELDLNPLASQTAHSNVILNGLQDSILVVQAKAQDLLDTKYPKYDLIVANIHYDVMTTLIHTEGFKQCRYFILSGLLRQQAEQIRYQLPQANTKILDVWGDLWVTFLGEVL